MVDVKIWIPGVLMVAIVSYAVFQVGAKPIAQGYICAGADWTNFKQSDLNDQSSTRLFAIAYAKRTIQCRGSMPPQKPFPEPTPTIVTMSQQPEIVAIATQQLEDAERARMAH